MVPTQFLELPNRDVAIERSITARVIRKPGTKENHVSQDAILRDVAFQAGQEQYANARRKARPVLSTVTMRAVMLMFVTTDGLI